MGRVDGWPQTPTPDPHPFLLGSHHGGRNWSLESPCFGVRTSGRSPKPKLQGLKFPLVFAQKHLAQAAPPPPRSPLPACPPVFLSFHAGTFWSELGSVVGRAASRRQDLEGLRTVPWPQFSCGTDPDSWVQGLAFPLGPMTRVGRALRASMGLTLLPGLTSLSSPLVPPF